ncbi:RNA exonuclease 4 [Halotydeus destructor]|nr:RNA exonuclease 4 [Halotydeus destructor]
MADIQLNIFSSQESLSKSGSSTLSSSRKSSSRSEKVPRNGPGEAKPKSILKQPTEGPSVSNNQLKRQKAREWRLKQMQFKKAGQSVYRSNEAKADLSNSSSLVKEKSSKEATKAVAIDCEMVGCGERGSRDVLARVSIVNLYGHVLYDEHAKPLEKVTDYRTFVSGVTPEDLEHAKSFYEVQKEVCELVKNRVLVGHAIKNDLRVLFLDHPKKDLRDTSKFFKATDYGGRGAPSLRKLTEHYLGLNIQTKAHDSVEDARATMRLYTMFKKQWEADIKSKFKEKYAAALDWGKPAESLNQ